MRVFNKLTYLLIRRRDLITLLDQFISTATGNVIRLSLFYFSQLLYDCKLLAVDVSDPAPTCGFVSPPIRGQDATLRCSMVYYNLGDEQRVNPGAEMTASIGWAAAAGTGALETKTPLPNDAGETLQGDVTRSVGATEEEVPSYTCTTQFQFANRSSATFIYALNTVTYTCDTSAVKTWCKYNILYKRA